MNPIDKAFGIVMLVCAFILLVIVWAESAEEDPFIFYPNGWNEVTGTTYERSYLPSSEHLCRTPSVYISENEEYYVITQGDIYVY